MEGFTSLFFGGGSGQKEGGRRIKIGQIINTTEIVTNQTWLIKYNSVAE